ncbi:SnoaL-like domain-containing protein [Asanoa hainanensis]|uniref:SnoaL-like domain-containing protein n=1 Tax=Asanoa hainanensis TaxID=560556 RepID=A0A239GQK6_9ACTN|nr:nuclear transport factor 2 family protein [Asanoa hainanensis]SNS71420.1 SnoaL-like domain-containing protein [Asanoa hainanensis]
MSELAEIVRRLDALEAAESIKRMKARYWRFVDEKKYDDLVALFAPGAKIVIHGTEWPSARELVDATREYTGGAPTVHHGHMPEIEILGEDVASGVWMLEDLVPFKAGENAPPGHRGYGMYRETYRRIEGIWLIDSLELTRFRMDPMDNWVREA